MRVFGFLMLCPGVCVNTVLPSFYLRFVDRDIDVMLAIIAKLPVGGELCEAMLFLFGST